MNAVDIMSLTKSRFLMAHPYVWLGGSFLQLLPLMQRAAAEEKHVLEATCTRLTEELNERSHLSADEIAQLQAALDHANARLADSRADFVNQLSEMSRNAYADAEKKMGAQAEAARAKMRDEFAQALYKAVFKDLLYRSRLGRLSMTEEELKQTAYRFGASGQYDTVLSQMREIYAGAEAVIPSSSEARKQEKLLERQRSKPAVTKKP